MTDPRIEAARAALHDNAVPGCAKGSDCTVAHAYYAEVARVAVTAADAVDPRDAEISRLTEENGRLKRQVQYPDVYR